MMHEYMWAAIAWAAPGLLVGVYNYADSYRAYPLARGGWRGECLTCCAMVAWQGLMGPVAVMETITWKAREARGRRYHGP